MRMHLIALLGLLLVSSCLFGQEVRPLDGMRVTIYNVPEDISGEYFIQENNVLQLPYLKAINTEGMDYASLKNEISLMYSNIYKEPELVIVPLFRINILGEVNNPGTYYVSGVETVTDVISMAGGETSDADLGDVKIIRQNEEIEVDAEEILKEGKKDKDLLVKPGDKLYVDKIWLGGARNTSVIVSAIAVVATVVALIVNN